MLAADTAPSQTAFPWRSPGFWLMALLTLLPMLLLYRVVWMHVDNSPQDDDYLQSFYVVMQHLRAQTLLEELQALYWNYFQHNGVFAKLLVLLVYHLSGHVDLQLMNLLGNTSLCLIVLLLAHNALRTRLPLYTIPMASWMVCSLYPWTVITWPMCPLFYFGTVLLAFTAFHCLDLPKPRPLVAIACLWLAVFTMANGILAIGIAAVQVGYRHYSGRPYPRSTLLFLGGGTLLCMLVYAVNFNLFDSSVYGAKTVEQSFTNVGGRLVDFLESVGAVPFFPNVYREGKIALGVVLLLLTMRVLLSKAAWESPAIVGLLLFNLGTIFVTSLFRYSAGSNNGYQIFTTLTVTCILVLGAASLPRNARYWPWALLVMALAFNGNALQHNLPLIAQHNAKKTAALTDYLTTGRLHGEDRIFGPLLREALERDIYRPLQQHRALPIARTIATINECASIGNATQLSLTTHTTAEAFALALDIPAPANRAQKTGTLWLCGAKNYRLTVTPATAASLTVLLDKRRFAAGTYRVQLQYQDEMQAFGTPVTIEPVAAYSWRAQDCQALKTYTRYQSIQPIFDYFCQH